MPRTIFTDIYPRITNAIPKDAVLITPSAAAAANLGVPFQSLRSVAQNILKEKGIGIAAPLISLRALKSAIGSIMSKSNESAEAARARDILTAVLRSGVDLEMLRRHGSRRVKTFAVIASLYVEKLRQSNLIDREAVLAECCKVKFKPRKIILFGYFRARPLLARPEEIEFIDKLAGEGSIFYLPCSEDSLFDTNRVWTDRLLASGWEIAAAESDYGLIDKIGVGLAVKFAERPLTEDSEGDVRLQRSLPFTNAVEKNAKAAALVYPDIEAEVRGTLGAAKNLITNGTSAEKIAVVCRNLKLYAPIIASVAREYGLAFDITHEISIRETAFGNFINLLIETRQSTSESDQNGDFKFETAARMLRHRYGPGIADDKWPDIRKSHIDGFDKWAETVEAVRYLAAPDAQSSKNWVVWLKNILSEFGAADAAAQDPSEAAALESFTQSLDILAADDEQTFKGFAANVIELLSNLTVPFGPFPGGIRLCQPNTITACEFDHVFVAGLAEGILPEAVADSTIIDFCERRQLAENGIYLEDAAEVSRWETLSFYFVLLAAAKSVTLSYPRRIDREEKLPSAFFERLGLQPVEARERFISSVEEHRQAFLARGEALADDQVFAGARRRLEIEKRRESDQPCDEYDGVIGIGINAAEHTWSVSSLAKIGSCPFMWFADKMLKLGSLEETEIELSARTKGALYHKTLEIAVRRSMYAADLRAALLENLEAAFAEAESSDAYSLAQVENWELRRCEHLDALRNAICSDSFIDEGSRVIEVEKKFRADWYGLQLRGTIDRIDETRDGLKAVDYKTGLHTSKVKDECGRLKIDLQLPIYSHAALPKLYPGRAIAPGIYMRLAKGETETEKPTELNWLAASIKTILAEGRFAVDPDTDEAACKYCEYDGVCRRGPRIARKTSR